MNDSEKVPKPVVYISDQERVDRYLHVASQGYEKIALYWKSNPPDQKRQPITSGLVEAYVERLEIQTSAAGGGLKSLITARENHPAIYAELRELGSWIEPIEPVHLNPKVTDKNEDALGDMLVAMLGFSYSEARALLRSQRRPPKGAPNKRALTLKMFDAMVASKWSYAKIASKMCDCELRTHADLCRERVRKRIKELESVLPRYGIQYAREPGEK